MTAPLILASTSPWRRELLERLGVPFECVAPGVDESVVKARGGAPEDIARTLAEAKARAVAAQRPDAIVIGSDQVCALDDRIFDAPGDVDGAIAQLEQLAGREHRLLTATAILGPDGEARVDLMVHRMSMRALSRDALARYVAHDDPRWCAGAYRIESRGVALFDRIDGGDATGIIGLPLTTVVRRLAELGIAIP